MSETTFTDLETIDMKEMLNLAMDTDEMTVIETKMDAMSLEEKSETDTNAADQDLDLDDVFMSDSDDRSFVIADLLRWSYALRMRPTISEIVHKKCQGCFYDHPSQVQHDVCIKVSRP